MLLGWSATPFQNLLSVSKV